MFAVGALEGILKSTDSGATWAPAVTGLNATNAAAVTADANDNGYTIVYNQAFTTTDGGEQWSLASNGLTHELHDVAMVPGTTIAYIATLSGRYSTTDFGANWNPIAPVASARSVAVAPSDPGLVYFVGHTSIAVDPFAACTAYRAPGGVTKTTNCGASWESLPDPLFFASTEVTALAIDPKVVPVVYALVDTSRTELDNHVLFRSSDGGTTWAAVPSQLDALMHFTALALDPSTTPTTIFIGTEGAGIFRSVDEGATWTPLNRGLSSPFINDLEFVDGNPPALYAATNEGGVNVYRAVCGDGTLDTGEECDPILLAGHNDTSGPCVITDSDALPDLTDGQNQNCGIASCGDGFVCNSPACTSGPGGGVEQCDDENLDPGDGCEPDCSWTPVSASGPAQAGVAVTTDGGATGATLAFSLQTSVTPPANGGTISIDQNPTGGNPGVGYGLLGQSVAISAPPPPSGRLTITFELHPSALPPGVDAASVNLMKDGVLVANCTGPGTPDPCKTVTVLPNMNLLITAETSTASDWMTVLPVKDSVVLPPKPLNLVLPRNSSLTKMLPVVVRNADAAAQTIQLTAAAAVDGCTGVTVGVPDFGTAQAATPDSATLAAGAQATAKVPVAIDSSLTSFNRRAPHRCRLTLSTLSLPEGGSIDPTPDNNTASVEINVADRNDPDQNGLHESKLRSIAPVRLKLGSATAKVKAIAPAFANADAFDPDGHTVSLSVNDGDCPAGTLTGIDVDGKRGAQVSTRLKQNKTRTGKVKVTIQAADFSPTALAPGRCTGTVTVDGPAGNFDPDFSNNTTRVVIDVVP